MSIRVLHQNATFGPFHAPTTLGFITELLQVAGSDVPSLTRISVDSLQASDDTSNAQPLSHPDDIISPGFYKLNVIKNQESRKESHLSKRELLKGTSAYFNPAKERARKLQLRSDYTSKSKHHELEDCDFRKETRSRDLPQKFKYSSASDSELDAAIKKRDSKHKSKGTSKLHNTNDSDVSNDSNQSKNSQNSKGTISGTQSEGGGTESAGSTLSESEYTKKKKKEEDTTKKTSSNILKPKSASTFRFKSNSDSHDSFSETSSRAGLKKGKKKKEKKFKTAWDSTSSSSSSAASSGSEDTRKKSFDKKSIPYRPNITRSSHSDGQKSGLIKKDDSTTINVPRCLPFKPEDHEIDDELDIGIQAMLNAIASIPERYYKYNKILSQKIEVALNRVDQLQREMRGEVNDRGIEIQKHSKDPQNSRRSSYNSRGRREDYDNDTEYDDKRSSRLSEPSFERKRAIRIQIFALLQAIWRTAWCRASPESRNLHISSTDRDLPDSVATAEHALNRITLHRSCLDQAAGPTVRPDGKVVARRKITSTLSYLTEPTHLFRRSGYRAPHIYLAATKSASRSMMNSEKLDMLADVRREFTRAITEKKVYKDTELDAVLSGIIELRKIIHEGESISRYWDYIHRKLRTEFWLSQKPASVLSRKLPVKTTADFATQVEDTTIVARELSRQSSDASASLKDSNSIRSSISSMSSGTIQNSDCSSLRSSVASYDSQQSRESR